MRTPPRKEAHGHRGHRAPEPQLPPGGTRVVPQIFSDVRARDVGPDRRSGVWSPGNVLGPIHTKDARFFCCRNSAADISKSHTFKWDPLADEVLEAA